MIQKRSQREIAHALLETHGILRLSELQAAGVTPATTTRMERDGELTRLARGLYQLSDAALDGNHSLAEAAKRLPQGVVCLVSALAFYNLTDQMPRWIWMAIDRKKRVPRPNGVPIHVVRFSETFLSEEVETHVIEGVPVKVFGVAKTVADCFRHRNKIGLSVAVEGLREALYQRKATPAEIGRQAERGRIFTVIRPYLEALTA